SPPTPPVNHRWVKTEDSPMLLASPLDAADSRYMWDPVMVMKTAEPFNPLLKRPVQKCSLSTSGPFAVSNESVAKPAITARSNPIREGQEAQNLGMQPASAAVPKIPSEALLAKRNQGSCPATAPICCAIHLEEPPRVASGASISCTSSAGCCDPVTWS